DELDAKANMAHSPDNYAPRDLAAKLVDVTAKSDWLSPLLFGLAPLALLRRETRRHVTWLWLYVAYLFLTWWLFTHRIDRFWVPLIPVVSLLAGIGATWLPRLDRRTPAPTMYLAWKAVLGSCLVLAGLFNLRFITTPYCGYNDYLLD